MGLEKIAIKAALDKDRDRTRIALAAAEKRKQEAASWVTQAEALIAPVSSLPRPTTGPNVAQIQEQDRICQRMLADIKVMQQTVGSQERATRDGHDACNNAPTSSKSVNTGIDNGIKGREKAEKAATAIEQAFKEAEDVFKYISDAVGQLKVLLQPPAAAASASTTTSTSTTTATTSTSPVLQPPAPTDSNKASDTSAEMERQLEALRLRKQMLEMQKLQEEIAAMEAEEQRRRQGVQQQVSGSDVAASSSSLPAASSSTANTGMLHQQERHQAASAANEDGVRAAAPPSPTLSGQGGTNSDTDDWVVPSDDDDDDDNREHVRRTHPKGTTNK